MRFQTIMLTLAIPAILFACGDKDGDDTSSSGEEADAHTLTAPLVLESVLAG